MMVISDEQFANIYTLKKKQALETPETFSMDWSFLSGVQLFTRQRQFFDQKILLLLQKNMSVRQWGVN